MSASTTITLDTTAPVVDVNVIDPAVVGQPYTLGYTSSEPLASALLHLANGSTAALNIGASRLSIASLPATPNDLQVADDVGNATVIPIAAVQARSTTRVMIDRLVTQAKLGDARTTGARSADYSTVSSRLFDDESTATRSVERLAAIARSDDETALRTQAVVLASARLSDARVGTTARLNDATNSARTLDQTVTAARTSARLVTELEINDA